MGVGPDGPVAGSLDEVAAAQAAAFEISQKAEEKARKEREEQRNGGSDRLDGGRLNSL
jgi:hypothetical protein